MAGKRGQKSDKPSWVPAKYAEDFLAGLDGRTQVARELKSRLTELQDDLGGEETLSYQRRALCKRAIYLEARADSMEAAMACGNPVDLGQYVMAVNSMVGLFRTLGLDRQIKNVSLRDYLTVKANDR